MNICITGHKTSSSTAHGVALSAAKAANAPSITVTQPNAGKHNRLDFPLTDAT
jgi:hypothetical protein